jgi:hypothetical protein
MSFRPTAVWKIFLLFGRAHSGAVAVEFGLTVWLLLFALLFLADMGANFIVFGQIDDVGQSLAQKLRAGEIDPRLSSAQMVRDQFLCPALPNLNCDRFVLNLAPTRILPTTTVLDVSSLHWCPGGPQEAVMFQLAYPTPFLTRLWAGDYADQTLYYVRSFALRNAPDRVAGVC